MPKVSVIVPCYNVEKYLEKCISSILNQTLKDIEIICINDGSTDKSLDILKELAQKDSRIILYSQSNAGLSAARNSGLNIAKGDYIVFIDSDDYIETTFLELLYNKAINKQADIVASDVIYDNNGNLSNKNFISKATMKHKNKTIISLKDKYKFLKSVTVWNKIYKRTIIEDNNIRFVNGCNFEDNAFSFLVVSFAKKILVEPKAKYYYRILGNSISSKAFNTEKVFDFIKIIDSLKESLLEYVNNNGLPLDVIKMFEAFSINSFYNWSRSTSKDYKQSFNSQILERLKDVKLKDNYFIDFRTNVRYCKILHQSLWKTLFILK